APLHAREPRRIRPSGDRPCSTRSLQPGGRGPAAERNRRLGAQERPLPFWRREARTDRADGFTRPEDAHFETRSLEPVDELLPLASDPVVLDDEPSRAPQGLVI